jgi:hypothetical protein
MWHRHLGVGADVHHQAITRRTDAFDVGGLLSQEHQIVNRAAVVRGDVVGARDVLLRDHENMDGRLGRNVIEGQRRVGLRHLGRWNFTGHDFAK